MMGALVPARSSRRPKVLFVTDSLGLPRVQPTRVIDDEVWVNRVAGDLADQFAFLFYTVGGLHTNTLMAALGTTFGAFRPDIIVLQVGIVDCAAKALTENERKVVERLPAVIQRPIHRFIRRNYARIIRMRDCTYVPESQFRTNLHTLRDHFASAEFVVVPIGLANRAYKQKNPLIERNITRYNTVLQQVFGPAFASEIFDGADLEQMYIQDNHHLSARGHATVARHVSKRLEQLVGRKTNVVASVE